MAKIIGTVKYKKDIPNNVAEHLYELSKFCSKHDTCDECPLFFVTSTTTGKCIFGTGFPSNWDFDFKEKEA